MSTFLLMTDIYVVLIDRTHRQLYKTAYSVVRFLTDGRTVLIHLAAFTQASL